MLKNKLKVSKNKKKTWRKYFHDKALDDALEDQRLEERLGKPFSEREDSLLFYIQHTGEKDNIQDSYYDLSKKEKLKILALKPFKCDEVLKPTSNVPALNNAREKSKNIKFKKINCSKFCVEKNKKKNKQELKSFLKSIVKVTNDKIVNNNLTFEYDPWNKTKLNLQKDVPFHLHDKPSLQQAVEVPHPGMSYNPSYKNHQELLILAKRQEEEREKKEKKISKQMKKFLVPRKEAPTMKNNLLEMSQGLFDSSSDDDNEMIQSNHEKIYNPPVCDEDRKPLKKRRKEKEHKIFESKRLGEKRRRIREAEVFRLKTIMKDIVDQEHKIAEHRKRKLNAQYNKEFKPKILSHYNYEDSGIDFLLTDDLTDSLRKIKCDVHLLEDRFLSFQRRNIIEPRQRAKRMKPKYKPKKYIRKSNKLLDPNLSLG